MDPSVDQTEDSSSAKMAPSKVDYNDETPVVITMDPSGNITMNSSKEDDASIPGDRALLVYNHSAPSMGRYALGVLVVTFRPDPFRLSVSRKPVNGLEGKSAGIPTIMYDPGAREAVITANFGYSVYGPTATPIRGRMSPVFQAYLSRGVRHERNWLQQGTVELDREWALGVVSHAMLGTSRVMAYTALGLVPGSWYRIVLSRFKANADGTTGPITSRSRVELSEALAIVERNGSPRIFESAEYVHVFYTDGSVWDGQPNDIMVRSISKANYPFSFDGGAKGIIWASSKINNFKMREFAAAVEESPGFITLYARSDAAQLRSATLKIRSDGSLTQTGEIIPTEVKTLDSSGMTSPPAVVVLNGYTFVFWVHVVVYTATLKVMYKSPEGIWSGPTKCLILADKYSEVVNGIGVAGVVVPREFVEID